MGSRFFFLCSVPALLGMVAVGGEAATISWQTPADISTRDDISTSGILVEAINFGNGTEDPEINGVTFTGTDTGQATAQSDFSALDSNVDDGANTYGNVATGTDALAYNEMMDSFAYHSEKVTQTVTLKDLTTGSPYLVQFFLQDGRGEGSLGDWETFDGTETEDGSVHADGEYIIGTFTADATGQQDISLYFYADRENDPEHSSQQTQPRLNGYQVRLIPEPNSLLLAGFAMFGLAALSRRRRVA